MKKPALTIALIFLAIGSIARAVETPGTFAEAASQATAANKPLLIEFSTTW